MADPVEHLFSGHDNGDGTITVTSGITDCCRVWCPEGLGTIDPAAVTCPKSADSSNGNDRG